MYVCIYVCVCVCMYVCVCMHVCICVYMYVCMYVRTCVRTYIAVQSSWRLRNTALSQVYIWVSLPLELATHGIEAIPSATIALDSARACFLCVMGCRRRRGTLLSDPVRCTLCAPLTPPLPPLPAPAPSIAPPSLRCSFLLFSRLV